MSVTIRGIARRSRFWGSIVVLLLLLAVLGLWRRIFIFIGSGEEGVLWSRFGGGTVLTEVYGEGFHAIWPWNRMYIYDTRVQEIHGDIMVLSNNGLELQVKFSSRFHPQRDLALATLHQQVGPAYKDKVVRPEVVAAIRQVLGNYTTEQIYSSNESNLLEEMASFLRQQIEVSFITFDDIMIQELKLPKVVSAAIDAKLEQRHLALSYEYRLARERQERDRKQIEAEGIAAFQRTSGISILQWRGIEATLELAKSPNSKIIVIGNDAGSLPVIVNPGPQ